MGLNGNSAFETNRDICLLVIISRILARILGTRIARHLEETRQLQNFQWGFRAARGCRDAILVLRIMCEMVADLVFAAVLISDRFRGSSRQRAPGDSREN